MPSDGLWKNVAQPKKTSSIIASTVLGPGSTSRSTRRRIASATYRSISNSGYRWRTGTPLTIGILTYTASLFDWSVRKSTQTVLKSGRWKGVLQLVEQGERLRHRDLGLSAVGMIIHHISSRYHLSLVR